MTPATPSSTPWCGRMRRRLPPPRLQMPGPSGASNAGHRDVGQPEHASGRPRTWSQPRALADQAGRGYPQQRPDAVAGTSRVMRPRYEARRTLGGSTVTLEGPQLGWSPWAWPTSRPYGMPARLKNLAVSLLHHALRGRDTGLRCVCTGETRGRSGGPLRHGGEIHRPTRRVDELSQRAPRRHAHEPLFSPLTA